MHEVTGSCYIGLMMPPEIKYICRNPNCVWEGQERIVTMRSVGPGLFERPTPVVCECDKTKVLYRVDDELGNQVSFDK